MPVRPRPLHSAFTSKYPQRQRSIITPCKVTNFFGPQSLEGKALWDTGATNSVISSNFAPKLQLLPIDRSEVRGVHGSAIVDNYLINILLPNNVEFQQVEVREGELGDEINILIGMDIIGSGDFTLCAGSVFSYCNPPFDSPIDLVDKANKINPKIQKQNERIMKAGP